MSTQMPLVSIAVITYNQKGFLQEAVESVLAQSYQNLEIVVGDDGSTDGTHEMLKDYQHKFPGKFVLRLSPVNRGITITSNEVFFASTGKYMAWLGGDDLMLKDKVQKQVEYLESHPQCAIVYHNLDVFASDTGKTIRFYNTKKDCYQGDVKTLIKYGTFNGACSTMLRRNEAPSYGFDKRLPVASDWLHWIETLRKGGSIEYIDEILGRYRRHSKNVSGKASPLNSQAVKDHFETLEILKTFPENFKSEINYRYSILYTDFRKDAYFKNLKTSLGYNFLNLKSWVYLLAYIGTAGRLKL